MYKLHNYFGIFGSLKTINVPLKYFEVFITSDKEIVFLPLSACLHVCEKDNKKNVDKFWNFLEGVKHVTNNIRLDFGGDLNHLAINHSILVLPRYPDWGILLDKVNCKNFARSAALVVCTLQWFFYTVFHKNDPYLIAHNFGKCWPILKNFSLLDSAVKKFIVQWIDH